MKTTIRKWRTEDAPFLAESLSNKAILNNLRDGLPYPYTEKDALEYINAMNSADPNDTFAYAVIADDKVVGSIGAFRQGNIHSRTAELGYYLDQNYWGKGIMSSAVSQLCDLIFSTTDIVRIFAEPFAYNVGSCRVLEKSGFVKEGVLKNNACKNSQIIDMVMYSLTKQSSEYPVRRLNLDEIPSAIELCDRIFMKFEAPEYSEEGIASFEYFLKGTSERKDIIYYGAFDGDKVVGVIAMRPHQHICLFFVDDRYHRKGIGKSLFTVLRQELPDNKITVNSSPYAVEVYKKLGFVPTDNELCMDGIRFTPMKFANN